MIRWNGLLIAFLSLFVAAALVREGLAWLNVRHLRRHGGEVPAAFRGQIDAATLAKISRYTADKTRFGSFTGLFDDAVVLVVLLTGLLPWLLGRLPDGETHFVLAGLGFFALLALGSTLVGLPFEIYSTFGIEKRYGFSTITPRLWLIDQLKSLAISAALLGPLAAAFLALLRFAPANWWFWTWILFAAFQLLLIWLYPALIAPLFNRFEPVKDEGLRAAIESLAARAGLKTEGIYQSDAGKRSRHTNAYFTGIGRTKRIVLFDTLLVSHTPAEIVAVLAHEIGHWQKHHILKQLLLIEALSLALFWIASQLVAWPFLYETFGFSRPVPFVGLVLLAILFGPLTLLVTPLFAAMQRRFERAADDAVAELVGTTAPLAAALKRLAKENLANLHPHPLYAHFFYSHPPLVERVARLAGLDP